MFTDKKNFFSKIFCLRIEKKKFILPTSWLYYLSCLARKLCWLNLTMAYMCISDKWLLMVSYLPCKLCKKTCDSNQQKNRHPYRILRIVHHCHENTHNKKVNFHQNKVKRKIKCLTSCQDLEKRCIVVSKIVFFIAVIILQRN